MKTIIAAGVALLMSLNVDAVSQETTVSTGKDTKKTSITVYNGGFGLVREQRMMNLKSGMNDVRFEDVASQIDPTSISFKSMSFPSSLSVREQNYQYDLLNPTSILNKSVGKTVRFRRMLGNGQSETIEGTLLNPPTTVVADGSYNSSMNYNGLVIKTKDGKVLLNPTGEVLVDELPTGLLPVPSLLWKLYCNKPGQHETEVAYTTNGINWNADYVALVNDDESKVDITGWVTLDNKSGAMYKDAQLQLVAGDVRRVQNHTISLSALTAGVTYNNEGAFKAAPEFHEESFFEYHLYTLDGTTTINNNETKQMQLMNANNVSVKRKLIFDSAKPTYVSSRGGGQATDELKANVIVEVKNSQDNNMGMPLPKGKVRMYKNDKRGNVQFLGEDETDHTPKDETLRLYIGDAFDVVATRKQTDVKQLGDRSNEMSYEVTVRNRKETSTDVYILEHFWGEWEVTKNNAKFNKLDARSLEFPITLAKGESKTITFTVRTRW
ncbi:MAG: DUF4139 domain-containing protein [Candidatus Kapaibacterium sp.]